MVGKKGKENKVEKREEEGFWKFEKELEQERGERMKGARGRKVIGQELGEYE